MTNNSQALQQRQRKRSVGTKILMMKVLENLPNPKRKQAGLHQQNRPPHYTLQSKLQAMHFSSQMSHENRMTRSPRQIVMEATMLSVPLLELQAVLPAVLGFLGREKIARKRIGSR